MVPAVLTACVLLAGCTTEAPAPGTETTSVAPDSAAADLVRAAAEATKKLASAHVVVAIHGKFDRLGPVTKADADVQSSPLTANGNVTYDTGVVAPFVLENDRVSVRLMNEWSEVGTVSDFIPSAMIDPEGACRHCCRTSCRRFSSTAVRKSATSTRRRSSVPCRQIRSAPWCPKPAARLTSRPGSVTAPIRFWFARS